MWIEIKAVANRQLAEEGIAGLSLRGIARELGITAPAIYNYFPRLEDLITALTVDAFNSLAEAMDAAEAAVDSHQPYDNIMALCLAYREWAIAHPTVFQLLYGSPIPGYRAPADVTLPLGRRPFMPLFRWFIRAYQSGALVVPDAYQPLPPALSEGIASWRKMSGIDMPDALLVLLMSGWARIHGAVLLELFGHLQPLLGSVEAFYRCELDAFAELLQLGGRPGKSSPVVENDGGSDR